MSKHVCITGCTRGLGRGLADWFIEAGYRVSGFGRSAEIIEELQKSAAPDQVFFKTVDICDSESVSEFFGQLNERLGTPDLLVNDAGVINPNAPLWEISAEDFSFVMDVNVNGVANVLRVVAPLMIERGSGVMINLSSGWGRSTSAEVAPYCASKWAVEGLSQAMAQELPRGVAVAAMNPGIINTELLQSCFGEHASSYETAEQWAARAAPFLADLDSSINGRQLTAP